MKRRPSQLPQHVQRRADTERRGKRILEAYAEGLLPHEVCRELGLTYRQVHYACRRAREAARAP